MCEIPWPIVREDEKTVRLLRYSSHICYVSNINADFQYFCSTNCDTFFERTFILERHLTTWKERTRNVYPRSVYEVRENLFEKMDSFANKETSEKKRFKFSSIRL